MVHYLEKRPELDEEPFLAEKRNLKAGLESRIVMCPGKLGVGCRFAALDSDVRSCYQ